MDADVPVELVVFADDWGRHPSSAQHLVRRLLAAHPAWRAVWVNTIGTRRPRLGDLRRIGGVLRRWGRATPRPVEALPNLRVVSPRMYPGFRTAWQRRLNTRLVAGAMTRALEAGDGKPRDGSPRDGKPRDGHPSALGAQRVVVTTLPITADLVGRVGGVDRWVYYCVDDFSVWPGADHAVMDAMERELVAKVDAVVCVSEVLRERVRGMMNRQGAVGAKADDVELLTHGVELEHWSRDGVEPIDLRWTKPVPRPVFLFWGLLDERMDADWWRKLSEAVECTPAQVGPIGPEPGLRDLPNSVMPGAVNYAELPRWAAWADVLVMPYVDAPVTRAMQPLKLLEYLATYKPVVVRDLPATRAWADCCDVVATAEDFVRVCLERAKTGLPAEQRAARERRLPGESWSEKARRFERILVGSR